MHAGAQAPRNVLDATARHLLEFNVQRGGRYPKSVEVDRVITEARRKVALFLNAIEPRRGRVRNCTPPPSCA
jgi:selenocysteine lyase/cysteine desulfurase